MTILRKEKRKRRCAESTLLVAVLLTTAGATLFHGDALAADSREDLALKAPEINTAPGEKYADSARLFQGIPSIERAPGGRLWAAWYGGGAGEGPHNYCMLVTSGDDGATWSSLKMVIDPEGDVRAFDECLWVDPKGRLWFFWMQGWSLWDGRSGVWAVVTENPDDENPAWSAPRRLCNGIMMNKPTVLSTGEWLLPAAIWEIPPVLLKDNYLRAPLPNERGSNAVVSVDEGKTWALRGGSQVKQRACDEHMFVEKKDGTLWTLVRTQYGVGESFSSDRGKTWVGDGPSKKVTHIPHARFFIRRLASGKLLLVKHDPPNGKDRSHLKAFLSDDDGETWYGGLMLYEARGCSYPDGVQAPDDAIYIIHDFQRQAPGSRQIFMATFTEEDVIAGKCVSDRARLAVRVNRATGEKKLDLKEFKIRGNENGQELLPLGSAVIQPIEGEIDVYKRGALLFTNRKYIIRDGHAVLDGRKFIRSSIDRDKATCTQGGIIYVITPLPDRNQDSLNDTLLKQGFSKARAPEFLLFDVIPNNICSIYQKRAEAGENIALGKWGVIVF
jgi:hypothetical protein